MGKATLFTPIGKTGPDRGVFSGEPVLQGSFRGRMIANQIHAALVSSRLRPTFIGQVGRSIDIGSNRSARIVTRSVEAGIGLVQARNT